MTPRQEVLADLMEKFPKASTKAIMRMAYKKFPQLFMTEEHCRWQVRRLRGATGKHTSAVKGFERPKQPNGDYFGKLPEGLTQFDKWDCVKLECKRALVLSDIHLPYHSRSPLMTALDFGKKNDVDLILLNGDVADFFAVSFWEKDPRQRNFKNELDTVREFLSSLRAKFPKARIVYKLGNHEERFERYMRVKAPELLGVEDCELASLLKIKSAAIELVGEKRPIRISDLNILHGHEYRFAISNPVNPARGLFLRCKAYALCGHFHQSSYHTEKTVTQSVIATWSTGCLCDLHPEYAVMNNWTHGFALIEVDGGKFHVQNKVVRDGRIY